VTSGGNRSTKNPPQEKTKRGGTRHARLWKGGGKERRCAELFVWKRKIGTGRLHPRSEPGGNKSPIIVAVGGKRKKPPNSDKPGEESPNLKIGQLKMDKGGGSGSGGGRPTLGPYRKNFKGGQKTGADTKGGKRVLDREKVNIHDWENPKKKEYRAKESSSPKMLLTRESQKRGSRKGGKPEKTRNSKKTGTAEAGRE